MSKVVFIAFLMCLAVGSNAQNFFSSGDWYKFGVYKHGIQSIGLTELEEIGVDVTSPENIHVYSGGSAMLAQTINQTQYTEPFEISSWINISSSGEKSICFRGEAELFTTYSNDKLSAEKNLYSDTTFYYIHTESVPSNLLVEIDQDSLTTSFLDIRKNVHYEPDEENILGSGREWFSKALTPSKSEANYSFDISDFGEQFEMNYEMVGSSSRESIYGDVYISDSLLASPRISRSNSGYGIKARAITGTIVGVDSIILSPSLNVGLKIRDQGDTGARLFLNYFNYSYLIDKSKVKENEAYYTLSDASRGISFGTTEINKLLVTDLETRSQKLITGFLHNDSIDFNVSFEHAEIILFNNNTTFHSPVFKEKIKSFDLTLTSNVELVIVYHSMFKTDVDRLATHKRSLGLDVLTVDIDHVIEQYGAGKKDVSALRNFMKYVYDESDSLKYLILFGDCSYDYKNRLGIDNNFIPVYQSRESFHNVQTFSSDDYYGFLDDTDGEWLESINGNHFLNISVGRIPVNEVSSASAVVNKIIRYETNTDVENWKNNIVFVADDKDNALHVKQVNELVDKVKTKSPFIVDKKIYVDAYDRSSGDVIQIREDLTQAIEEGAMVVNFTGHGSEFIWTEEEILTIQSIKELTNKDRLPLFVTATCEFGRYDDPKLVSGAEFLLLSETGAIGLVTTTRPVYASSNFTINKAFYEELFLTDQGSYRSLGDVFRTTKNTSLNNVFNRNFSLLGDPSIHLKLPQKEVAISEIANIPIDLYTDTLKLGEEFTIKARLTNLEGDFDSTYTGIADLTIYSESEEKQTEGYLGQKTIAYESSRLLAYEAHVPIVNGIITANVLLPTGINPTTRKMSVILHTHNENGEEAYGAYNDLIVGGSTLLNSNSPTSVLLTSSAENADGSYSSSPKFEFSIEDNEGLLLSDLVIGKNNRVVLDGKIDEQIEITPLLMLPEGSSKKASLSLSFDYLNRGPHTLELIIYDSFGEKSLHTFPFEVGVSTQANIYPNPVESELFLYIKRSDFSQRSNYTIEIKDIYGKEVYTLEGEVVDGDLEYKKDLYPTLENILGSGIYYYNVRVRYNNGSNYSSEGKFIKR